MNVSFLKIKALNLSIKWKLTFIITALMIGLIIVLTWTHITAQKKIMYQTLESHINEMRESLIATGKILFQNLIIHVEKDMAVFNISGAVESINTVVKTNKSLNAAILMDYNRNALLNSKNPELLNTILEDDISKQISQLKGLHVFKYKQHYIEIVSHVQFSTKPWGHLRLILNLEPLIKEIKDVEKQIQFEIYSIIKRTLLNALIFMSISFMIIYYLSGRITKKIINLTHSAELLSKGDFSVQIQKSSSNDEIAILQRSFAIMATNLQSLIKRLNNYNKKLASTVEERTIELKISEEKYKGLFNSSKDGIFYIHLDDTFQNTNFAFSKLTGYSSNQLRKMKIDDLIDNEYASSMEQAIHDIKQNGSCNEIELNIRHKSGALMPVAINAWLRKNNEGKPVGIWGFGRDISERKIAEKIREDVERVIRHDIKSPLNGIIGLSNLVMESSGTNETNFQYIENIKMLAKNSIQLIDNSLNMHKMELGTYQLQAIDCDLISILLQLKIEFLGMLKDKKIRIDYLYNHIVLQEDTTRTCLVPGEELLLNNLFANLLKNAIEASPKNGRITINIFREDNKIEIHMNNQGEIPENQRSKFFDKYTSSGKTKGTGLGTYSAKLLTQIHHGMISFQTSPTFGTTLIVSLPASEPDKMIDNKNIQDDTIENECPNHSLYGERLNVLVADDVSTNRLLIGQAIQSMTNWKTFYAENGLEAVETFQRHPVDVILMDYNMPDINGAEATKRIRDIEIKKKNTKKVRIIIISADNSDNIEGVDGYVLKYFDKISLFIENIVRLL